MAWLNRHRLDYWALANASSISPQAAAFLARTSGLDVTHQSAYIALINGLVADGIWATLDILYMFATADTTTANLNLINTSFTCTLTNSPTFTVDRGYAGNGTTSFINTNYNPATNGTNYLVNSAQISVWDMTSRAGDDTVIMGNDDGTHFIDTLLFRVGNGFIARVNVDGAHSSSFTNTGSQGFFTSSRTGASAMESLKNGISLGTDTNTSSAIPSLNIYCLARNVSDVANSFTTDQIGVVAVGGGLTSTQALSFYNRIHTYMQTIAGVS